MPSKIFNNGINERTLSRTAGADESDDVAATRAEGYIDEHRLALVRERQAVEFDAVAKSVDRPCAAIHLRFRRLIQHRE